MTDPVPTPVPVPTPQPWKIHPNWPSMIFGLVTGLCFAGSAALFLHGCNREPDGPKPPPLALAVKDGTTEKGRLFSVEAKGPKKVAWSVRGPGKVDTHEMPLEVWIDPYEAEGEYTVSAVGVAKGEAVQTELMVQVGHGPQPPPPIPPGPTPIPPGPTPTPTPIPGEGLRVLVVYDSKVELPPEQQLILTAKEVWDYLNTHCATGPDGKTKERRILPASADLTFETKTWQDAMKRPHASLPWILIGNGKTGFEGPLPATVADTMALLKKYGGP